MNDPKVRAPRLGARTARLVLGGILVVAASEWVASAISYRPQISADDLQAVAHHLPENEDAPTVLAAQWLGPRARMVIPTLRSVGRPDLRGIDELWVVDRARGSGWSSELERGLEGTPPFDSIGQSRFGGLSVHHLERDSGARLVSDSLASRPTVRTTKIDGKQDATNCRRAGTTYTCKRSGRVQPRLAEIDYRPRHCFVVDLDERHALTMQFEEFELGNVMRGHVGFGDFNARLRSDAPADIVVRVDGETRFRRVFTDDEGWAPFAFATDAGPHTVEIEIRVAARGTWQSGGYDPGRAHPVCIELRSFEEGGA